MKIKCPRCGFVTTFVADGELLRRDFATHGNRAAEQTCFNCQMPLTIKRPAPPAVTETPPAPAPQPQPTSKTKTETKKRSKTK